MRRPIRLGDPTSHGAVTHVMVMNKPLARVGCESMLNHRSSGA